MKPVRLNYRSYRWAYDNGVGRRDLPERDARKDCPFVDPAYVDAYWDGYQGRPGLVLA